ncbi:MAG: sigma-70 family RNA polymerase sigma factor [Actinomycetota bacterium]
MDKLTGLPSKVQRVPAKVHQAATWSETAFREVYSRYIRPVNAYILRRVRNHHDAEDLTAQVFVQALDHLDPQKGSDEVASWLFTSARNATANHSRRRRYVVSVEEVPEAADQSEDPGEVLLNEEKLGQVLDAIAKLPEERRKAIILRFVEQLPHAEIAEVLGRSETSARVLLHRTIAHLRKEVS